METPLLRVVHVLLRPFHELLWFLNELLRIFPELLRFFHESSRQKELLDNSYPETPLRGDRERMVWHGMA